MSRKPAKLGRRDLLRPPNLTPTAKNSVAVSQMSSLGYNRPDFPGYLGKIGSNVCENCRINQATKPGRAGEMKFQVDVTPEEARALLGLPDVKPMQKAMMEDIEGRMKKTLSAMEPDALFKMWLPAGLQDMEAWQKLFVDRVGAAVGRKVEEGS